MALRSTPEPRTRIYYPQQVVLSLQFAVCSLSSPALASKPVVELNLRVIQQIILPLPQSAADADFVA